VPITSIQTLGAGSACDGQTVTIRGIVTGIDDLYGSNFENIFKADSGIWIQNPTRAQDATTSSALFVAGIRRSATNPQAVIGSDITITGRVETKFGQVAIVPAGVGNTMSPTAQEVDLASVATIHTTGNALPAAVTLDKTLSETQNPLTRPYYRSLQGMRVTLPVGIATGGGTLAWQMLAPTAAKADKMVDERLAVPVTADANDFIYQWEASHDYNPGPGLEKIEATLLAINAADDERNPPETGVTDAAMKRVKNGRLYLIPASTETRGHLTTGGAKFYKQQLQDLLQTAPQRTM